MRDQTGGQDAETGSEAGWSRLLSDFGLLILAVSILVVPPWIGSVSRDRLRFEERAVRAFSIEVNSAPWYEWVLLEGIGEVRARQIVDYRKNHGPFRSLDDLRAIPGLPRGWLDRARPYLSLE